MRDFIKKTPKKQHEHAKMSIYKSIACVSTSGCDASNTSSSHGMDQASHKVLWDICPYLLEHVSKFLECLWNTWLTSKAPIHLIPHVVDSCCFVEENPEQVEQYEAGRCHVGP